MGDPGEPVNLLDQLQYVYSGGHKGRTCKRVTAVHVPDEEMRAEEKGEEAEDKRNQTWKKRKLERFDLAGSALNFESLADRAILFLDSSWLRGTVSAAHWSPVPEQEARRPAVWPDERFFGGASG